MRNYLSMKLTTTSLALAFSGANSAVDFSPIVEKGVYGTLLKVVNDTGNAQLIAENVPVSKFISSAANMHMKKGIMIPKRTFIIALHALVITEKERPSANL